MTGMSDDGQCNVHHMRGNTGRSREHVGRWILGGLIVLTVGIWGGWLDRPLPAAGGELEFGLRYPDFALVREGDRGQSEMWLCTLDGGAWKVANGVSACDVAFSPDGQHLAFVRQLPGPALGLKEAGICPYRYELWVARADGSSPRQLLEFPHDGPLQCPGEVGWSPDGERIYFGVAGSPTHREVWSVRRDGSDLQNHTWGWDFTVHPGGQISGITRGWIPFIDDPAADEKLLVRDWGMIYRAFFSPTGATFLAEVAGALVLIDWQAGEERVILPTRQAARRRYGTAAYRGLQISWHPDETGFAFTSGWYGDDDICYYDFATGEVRQLTEGPWDEQGPVFSSEGAYLAYVRHDPMGPRVCILTVEDGTTLEATWAASGDVGVIWRPRGQW